MAMGGVMLKLGEMETRRVCGLMRDGQITSAVITQYNVQQDINTSRRTYSYRAQFAFEVNGTRYEVQSNLLESDAIGGSKISAAKRKYQIGDSVEVRYDPKNPAEAEINKPWFLWKNSILLLGLGSVILVFGLWVVVFGKA